MARYNQSPDRIGLEPMKGRPSRPDEARRKGPQTSGASDRPIAARRPPSILRPMRIEELIALFALGTLGGALVVFIAFFAR